MPVAEIYERITLKGAHDAVEAELSRLLTCTPADPFGIDNTCPFNPTGHDFIAACGDVVCCHCGKVVLVVSGKEDTIRELIAKKRAADGYDPEFEATLARIWLCPHCQRRATILEVLIPVGDAADGEPLCPRCMCEGIEPIDGEPDLSVVAGGKK